MKHNKWTLGIGVTSSCNMKCPFCYSQDQRETNDLPLDRWISFVKSNAFFIKAINYGTGENTLSKTWYELIHYIRNYFPGIRQAITTNGYLSKAIEDSKKKDVLDSCIDEIDVSIDFANPEIHDKIRRFSGAYDMAVDTLSYCKEQGKHATIVILGREETLDINNLHQLFELAGSYNAFIRINIYRHVSTKSSFQYPGFSSVIKALDWIIKHYTVVSISEPVFSSIYGINNNISEDSPMSMRILSDGSITPSTYLITEEWVAGNICDDVLLPEIGQTPPFKRYNNDILPEWCKECFYAKTCKGGTRDRRLLKWGNLNHPDIYCPRFATEIVEKKMSLNPRILHNKNTIHSDYLPTIIFSPRNDG